MGTLYARESYVDPMAEFGVPAAVAGAPPAMLSKGPKEDGWAPLSRPATNPCMIILPKSIASRLPRPAVYLMVVRKMAQQCGTLKAADYDEDFKRDPSQSVMAFLDSEFQHVPITIAYDTEDFMTRRHDIRLHVHQDIVLESHTQFGNFEMSELTFDLAACRSIASCVVKIRHREMVSRHTWQPPEGKNFGVWWISGHPYLQVWLAASYRLPAALSPVTASGIALGVLEMDAVIAPPAPFENETLHNDSIEPIVLPGGQGRLVMGHTRQSHRDGFHVRYGGNYFQNFVLSDASFPFRLRHVSPPFCIPSGHNQRLCEVIQFVMSAHLTADHEILLVYGINDCESAAIRLRVDDVLAFTTGRAPRLVFSPTPARAAGSIP